MAKKQVGAKAAGSRLLLVVLGIVPAMAALVIFLAVTAVPPG